MSALSSLPSRTITDATVDGSELDLTFNAAVSAADWPGSQVVVLDGAGTHTWNTPTNAAANIIRYALGSGGSVSDPATYAITGHAELTNPTGPVTVV